MLLFSIIYACNSDVTKSTSPPSHRGMLNPLKNWHVHSRLKLSALYSNFGVAVWRVGQVNFPPTFLGRREYRDRYLSEVPKRNKGSTFFFRTRTPFRDISRDCFSLYQNSNFVFSFQLKKRINLHSTNFKRMFGEISYNFLKCYPVHNCRGKEISRTFSEKSSRKKHQILFTVILGSGAK